jgi:hypothetical protein
MGIVLPPVSVGSYFIIPFLTVALDIFISYYALQCFYGISSSRPPVTAPVEIPHVSSDPILAI